MSRTDSASRVFDAPGDCMFTALVDPQAIRRLADARTGGSCRMILTYAYAPVCGGKTTPDVPPGIPAQDHPDGMHSSLSNLATYLAARRADSAGRYDD